MPTNITGPKCPNHHEPLEIPIQDRMKKSGQAICPVSKCMFAWTQEVEERQGQVVKDKFGNIQHTFVITKDGENSVS